MNTATLYMLMKSDPRLQKDWERNQPRTDRAFESPLIARTPREVATAALLAIKLTFEPQAAPFLAYQAEPDLLDFAESQGPGGKRLANILTAKTQADAIARAAAFRTLQFYRCRATASAVVRMAWSRAALDTIAASAPDKLINPALRPTWAIRKAEGFICLARLAVDPSVSALSDQELRERLRMVPGLGPERADAVGVFMFRRAWPIVDEYLWRLFAAHGGITTEEARLQSYEKRRAAFEPYWKELQGAFPDDPNELAATLYVWADEAGRNDYRYDHSTHEKKGCRP
jgi:hypothetical protein